MMEEGISVKQRRRSHWAIRKWMVVLGVLATGGAVVAETLEEITVTATRMGREAVTKKVVGRSPSTGAPIEHLTLTWSVGYSDLDLSKRHGAIELDRRVHARAKAVCAELDRLFPLTPPDGASCAKDAEAPALDQAHKLIAAAEAAHPMPATP